MTSAPLSIADRADGRALRASRKRESRRQQILEAARRVFARNGFHNTHIADIIEDARIARGTFYLYFESKNAVFLDMLELLLLEVRSSIVGVDVSAGAEPLQEQLVDRLQRVLQLVIDNKAIAKILFREAVGLDGDVDARLRTFYQSVHRYIREALHKGKVIGILRDVDAEVSAVCVLGTIKQLIEHVVLSEDEGISQDTERLAISLLDFNLRGLVGVSV